MRKKITAAEADACYKLVSGGSGDDFAWASKSPRTWVAYASALRRFHAWCEERGLEPVPSSIDMVRAYLRHLMDERLTIASVTAFLAALAVAHRLRGHLFDRRPLRDTIIGLRRIYGAPPRQARPLLADELRTLLEGLDPVRASDVRDGALFALGWAAALRQGELVGLDWERPGNGAARGNGFVRLNEAGLTVILTTSKASQLAAVEIVVPVTDMPAAATWVGRWAEVARLAPGHAIFRGVGRGQHITDDRLTADSVARILRARLVARAIGSGASEAEALAGAQRISGHSLRAGFCTSAALAGVPEWKIRSRSRHKSAEMVSRYVRTAEHWNDSGLKGVGF